MTSIIAITVLSVSNVVLLWLLRHTKQAMEAQKSAMDAMKLANDAVKIQKDAEVAPILRTVDEKDATIENKDALVATLQARMELMAERHVLTEEKLKEREQLLDRIPEIIRFALQKLDEQREAAYRERSVAMYWAGHRAAIIQMGLAIRQIHRIAHEEVEHRGGADLVKSMSMATRFFTNTLSFVTREMYLAAVSNRGLFEKTGVSGDDEKVKGLLKVFDGVIKDYEDKARSMGSPTLNMSSEVANLTIVRVSDEDSHRT